MLKTVAWGSAEAPRRNAIVASSRIVHRRARQSAKVMSTAAHLARIIHNKCEKTIYVEDSLRGVVAQSAMTRPSDYESWTNAQLIERITTLEKYLRESNARLKGKRPSPVEELHARKARSRRQFDPSKYTTRYVAFKLAYLGKNYNGFEYHEHTETPLPTIEEELWKALMKTRLIFPEGDEPVSWKGCRYAKCGRTDKGVSAFGQVISLQVRSNRPRAKEEECDKSERTFHDIKDELEYPKMLNRVLPDDIRILAWCPSPPLDFSARFSCRERRYKYFFTQPAFPPQPGQRGVTGRVTGDEDRDGWLDIPAMRQAAKLYEGAHDFRNFCKLDAARQITNYTRQIFYSDIEEAPSCSSVVNFAQSLDTQPVSQTFGASKVYCLTLHGSAFLWHQVRHMIAVLFLVGQGREKPSIVSELLDVTKTPNKPMYEMADEVPLVLWDCLYPGEGAEKGADSLHWIYPEEQNDQDDISNSKDGRYGVGGINEVLWSGWRGKKIDEVLAGCLLDRVTHRVPGEKRSSSSGMMQIEASSNIRPKPESSKVFFGGNNARLRGAYVPILSREKMDSFEVMNARYRERKGLSVKLEADDTDK